MERAKKKAREANLAKKTALLELQLAQADSDDDSEVRAHVCWHTCIHTNEAALVELQLALADDDSEVRLFVCIYITYVHM